MKTALELDEKDVDEGEKIYLQNIRQHGWAGTHVVEDDDGPGFSYTTGFWYRFNAPELILFSLPSELSHQIFWGFYNDLADGKEFADNTPVSGILEGFDVVLKPVSGKHFSSYLGWNRWFYGGDNFRARQVFFPDKTGLFPWDASASKEFQAIQPNLALLDS